MTHKHIANLSDPAAVPSEGILSRTVYDDDQARVVWFGFAPGEELSEHTAAMPAIIHILHGEAALVVGGAAISGQPGTWIHMAARLPHSVHAVTPTILLLTMLKPPQ